VDSESDVSDEDSEVDLEHKDGDFALENEGNINVQSAFLRDMLSKEALVSEVVEG
jgi:hypothetical protein